RRHGRRPAAPPDRRRTLDVVRATAKDRPVPPQLRSISPLPSRERGKGRGGCLADSQSARTTRPVSSARHTSLNPSRRRINDRPNECPQPLPRPRQQPFHLLASTLTAQAPAAKVFAVVGRDAIAIFADA